MEISKALELLIDNLIMTDLIAQPEGYEEEKEKALDNLDKALEILENLGF